MFKLRFRQVHLDFHTSEVISGIGSEFDADEYIYTLKKAHVDSITTFSRCHHGMIYHDTKFPAKHPHLTCNLLAEQIRACHANDIRCPIYISVGLDEYMAVRHPEWLERGPEGQTAGAPLHPGFKKFCFASPYMDYVIEQTEEVLDIFGDEVDGLFFDIIGQGWTASPWCLAEYEKQGWDPTNAQHQQAMQQLLVDRYRERITDAVRAKNKTCSIFHNSGHIYPNWRPTLHTYSHFELESLPSGGWGYAHYPITQRYARGFGFDSLGMTGKFCKTWGHFNSYKPQPALEYECMNMLALGAKCSVGDQLHPRGKLDRYTYDLIGSVYEKVEACEPWCEDATPLTEVAIYNVEATGRQDDRVDSAMLGAYRSMLDEKIQFDVVDSEMDWSQYKVVILPDKILLDDVLQAKTAAYLAGGGSVFMSYESGLNPAMTQFVLPGMPAVFEGRLPYSPDFLNTTDNFFGETSDTPMVMYEAGLKVSPASGAEVLAGIVEPYFNREWKHFCSHHHTPPNALGPDTGAAQAGRIVYFAHPIFGLYGRHGMSFYRDMIITALRRLLPDSLVKSDGPGAMHITVNRQEEQKRTVVHMLYYVPEQRTAGPETVEEVIPLHDIKLSLKISAPGRVYLAPEGRELDFSAENGYTNVVVPELKGHTMVVFED